MSCPFWFEKEALIGLPQMGGEKHRELIFVLFGLLKATFLDRFGFVGLGLLKRSHLPLQSPHLGHLGQRLCCLRQRPTRKFYQIQKGNYRTLIARETLADIYHFAAIIN